MCYSIVYHGLSNDEGNAKIMKPDEYRNFLIASIPGARKASGGKEVLCRCRYCPDSKNPTHAHFYISVPQSEDELSFFNCYKCHSSGIVTNKTLVEWGIYDPKMGIDITLHNKKIMKNPRNIQYRDDVIYKLKYNDITIDDLSKYKLDYINTRLGIDLSFDDCIKHKIVINLDDILRQNNLPGTRDPRVLDILDSSFIGFVSVNNAFINMRRLVDKQLPYGLNKRYINYSLFNKFDNTHRFYVVPTQYDLRKPIRLHLSEGPFDSLGIYKNLRGGTMDNDIYSSIGGSGYKGIIKYFINTLKLPNLEINYYPDADVDQHILLDIAEALKPFNFPFIIHRNELGKDFGVKSDQMKEILFKVD